MRLWAQRCALILSLAVFLPLAARADSFTTSFTMVVASSNLTLKSPCGSGLTCQSGLQISAFFSPFDTSLGRLNGVQLDLKGEVQWSALTLPSSPLTGTVSWAVASVPFSYPFVPIYTNPCGYSPCNEPGFLVGGGPFGFDVNESLLSDPKLLDSNPVSAFEGSNPLTATLAFNCCQPGTIQAGGSKDTTPLTGSVEYRYTPVVPEPPTLWLLATGLLALGLVCWRRRSGQI